MTDGKQRRAGIPLQIRFPDDGELKERLEQRAKANNRSLNAEIMYLLDFVLDPRTVQMRDDSPETHSQILGQLTTFQRQVEPMILLMWEKLEMGPMPDDVHPRDRKPSKN